MLKTNWMKILPAVTAASTFAITSAFAFGFGGGGGGSTTVTPAVCQLPPGDDDATASIVTLNGQSHFKNGSNLALQLETVDDDDDSVAYGIVGNAAFPAWQQIQFDVSCCPDDESFLEIVGNNPFGFLNVQGILIEDLPLAAKQNNVYGYETLVCTSAFLAVHRDFGGPFYAGATLLNALIGQGSDGNEILIQNVSLNNGSNASYVMVTAAQNCTFVSGGIKPPPQ